MMLAYGFLKYCQDRIYRMGNSRPKLIFFNLSDRSTKILEISVNACKICIFLIISLLNPHFDYSSVLVN